MNQCFILVLVSILFSFSNSFTESNENGNSMHDSFISVSQQTCRPQNVKVHVIRECQVAKGMRWGMLIVEGGGCSGNLPRNSGGPRMRF